MVPVFDLTMLDGVVQVVRSENQLGSVEKGLVKKPEVRMRMKTQDVRSGMRVRGDMGRYGIEGCG